MTSKARRGALGKFYIAPGTGVYDACIFDVCSEARRVGSGKRAQTARQLCLGICRSAFKRCPDGLLVLMFDDSSRMHEARAQLHARRYKPLTDEKAREAREAGKVVVDGQAYAPAMVPYDAGEVAGFGASSPLVWPRLWASRHGKARAWDLLYKGFVWCHHFLASKTQRCIMWHVGLPYVWPYCKTDELRDLSNIVCNNTFGEADQRVCEAAKELVNMGYQRIWMQTVDTDFLLQALCTYSWGHALLFHLSLKNECVDVMQLCQHYGGGRAACRMTSAFWLMSAGGVDYCRGLVRFGFSVKDLLGLASSSKAPVLEYDGTRLVLCTRLVMQRLSGLKRRKVVSSVHDFVAELNSMSFCLALFAGFAKERRPCGGPSVPSVRCLDTDDRGFTSLFVRKVCDAEVGSENILITS